MKIEQMPYLMNIYEEIMKCKDPKGKFPSVNNRRKNTKTGKRPQSIFLGKRKPHPFYPNEPFYRGTHRYPKLYSQLKDYHAIFYPDHKYNVILINRKVQFLKHKDKGNVKNSMNLIVGIGDYDGGELSIFDFDKKNTFDIWCNPLLFNPFLYHQVEDFNGERLTITYYLI